MEQTTKKYGDIEIILRGPKGSGKTFLGSMIHDVLASMGLIEGLRYDGLNDRQLELIKTSLMNMPEELFRPIQGITIREEDSTPKILID